MVILDADGGYDAYLPKGTVHIIAQAKSSGFQQLLHGTGINVIVATPRLSTDPRYANDPEWQAFAEGGYTNTFERIPVVGTDVELYVLRGRRME